MKRGGTSLVACITSKYDFTEVGGEFLADAFLAFAYGGCGGVTEMGKDGIGIAEVHAQSAD